MFGMPILDVTIGLLFTYLLLSLIITASNELIETIIKLRGAHLAKGVEKLLGSATANEFFKHGLIQALSPNRWLRPSAKDKRQRYPSYLPPIMFVQTVMSLLKNMKKNGMPVDDWRQAITLLPDDHTKQALATLLDDAADDIEKFKKNLEAWFNTQMDRVGGWYKRKVQLITLGLAAALAVLLNADSIAIAKALWTDTALRDAVATQAEEFVKAAKKDDGKKEPGQGSAPVSDAEIAERVAEIEKRINQVRGLGLPIGWRQSFSWSVVKDALLGWVITALAISLGAPFWFDLLSKVITIRAAGKVPELKPPTQSQA